MVSPYVETNRFRFIHHFQCGKPSNKRSQYKHFGSFCIIQSTCGGMQLVSQIIHPHSGRFTSCTVEFTAYHILSILFHHQCHPMPPFLERINMDQCRTHPCAWRRLRWVSTEVLTVSVKGRGLIRVIWAGSKTFICFVRAVSYGCLAGVSKTLGFLSWRTVSILVRDAWRKPMRKTVTAA